MYPKRHESETAAQGYATVFSAVSGEVGLLHLVSGRGMADAEGGSD